MARRQELQRAKARRLREERESHELDGCTFRPEIRRAGGGGGGGAAAKGRLDLERCDAWLERREERLRREREAALARELDECTFRPAVAADDGGAAATEAVAAAETAALAPGTDEWVARQALARALRHQKAAPAYADGSRWTGALTTPKEFRLARSGRSSARCNARWRSPTARCSAASEQKPPPRARRRRPRCRLA